MDTIRPLFLVLTLVVFISLVAYAGEMDPHLEITIRQELGKLSGELTTADFESITILNAREQGIADLGGIERLVNLEQLNLRGNAIVDLSPLANLTKLTYLNLHSNTSIASLAPLARLTNLTTLIIANVPIGDQIHVLADLVNLTRLNVRNTNIKDLTVIAELMSQGALQNDWLKQIAAVVDLNHNPISISLIEGIDGYAPIREYWSNISEAQPMILPSYREQRVVINEVMSSNGRTLGDGEGDAEDWIELYNPTSQRINLSNHYLTDDPQDLFKWKIPTGTWIEAGGFLLIWASGKDRIIANQPHANFRIAKSGGESIILTRGNPITIIDYVAVPELERDQSYGRQPDAGSKFQFFDINNSSPGQTNNKAVPYLAPDPSFNPLFSAAGGFYQEAFLLELETRSDYTIYYTLDGTLPDPIKNPQSSFRYQDSILIAPEKVLAIGLTRTIRQGNTPEPPLTYIQSSYTNWFLPRTEQFKGTVIRAKAFGENGKTSEVVTQTYFVDPLGFQRHTLPVIAITVEPCDFFDYETGIYLPGIGYHDRLPWAQHHWGSGNFHGRGSLWERPMHIEFWETDGTLAFAQNAGVRIHGDASRAHAQKSLRIIASDAYDSVDSFRHEIFPERFSPFAGGLMDEYKTLILRNGGNTWEFTMFKDGLIQNLLHHTLLDVQHFRPCIVYINGEYWGIHNIRDRFDEWYLHYRYGVDPEQVEMFKDNVFEHEGNAPLDDLERDNYREVLRIIDPNYAENGYKTVDTLADPLEYQKVKEFIDLDTFLDYVAVQIYIQNFDWPGNNIRAWRLDLPENDLEAEFGHDGLWRWMIFDLDLAFSDYNMNNLANATAEYGRDWHNQSWATYLFRSLLQNEEFRIGFINRSADHMNSTFLPEVVIAEVDRLEALMEPEIGAHILRWNKPARNVESWRLQNNMLRIFAHFRPDNNRRHIWQYFDLPGMYEIRLETDSEYGYLQINSLTLTKDTPGVTDPNCWSGEYFQGVPIRLSAVPKGEAEFVRWVGVPAKLEFEPTITLTPQSSLVVKAIFE